MLIILIFFEFVKEVLINKVASLIMSPKFTNLGYFEIKIFLKKGYDIKIGVHDVNNKTLSRDLNYIVDLVM